MARQENQKLPQKRLLRSRECTMSSTAFPSERSSHPVSKLGCPNASSANLGHRRSPSLSSRRTIPSGEKRGGRIVVNEGEQGPDTAVLSMDGTDQQNR